jgi:hypothetical protein
MIGINRRSATENGYALVDPALKSRARITWSLRDREDGCSIYFSKTINPRLNSRRRDAAEEDVESNWKADFT